MARVRWDRRVHPLVADRRRLPSPLDGIKGGRERERLKGRRTEAAPRPAPGLQCCTHSTVKVLCVDSSLSMSGLFQISLTVRSFKGPQHVRYHTAAGVVPTGRWHSQLGKHSDGMSDVLVADHVACFGGAMGRRGNLGRAPAKPLVSLKVP